MEVEFPNSASVGAYEWPLVKGGRWARLQISVRFGLFHHPRRGPVLIDTGYTARVTSGSRSLALRLYAGVLKPRLDPVGQLDAFLGARGLARDDIATVILTHFHADHISACRDLPRATFHASGDAYRRLGKSSPLARLAHGVFLELLPDDFAERMSPFEDAATIPGPLGLGPCHDLFGDGTVLIVPLPGHAAGHVGVAFPAASPPLLYAADTEWLRAALPVGRSGIAARLVGDDALAHARSKAIITAFEAAGGRVVLCHDPDPLP